MKFGLVNDVKTIALKGEHAICPICGTELIAKCGDIKVHHWAHKSTSNCDTWWENETEWHRKWKDNYPIEWQEIIQFDSQTGEKHIADIKTKLGLVIEFQHSSISRIERESRESFYNNMIWVVDGTRLKNDYSKFKKGKNGIFFIETNNPSIFKVDMPDTVFPLNWLDSKVPVVFDFFGGSENTKRHDDKNYLWCLFPKHGSNVFVGKISKEHFIHLTTNYESIWTTNENRNVKEPKRRLSIKNSSRYIYDRKKNIFIKRRRL